MNKKEFIEELRKNLSGLSEEDTKEILEDYEEHFRVGKKNKRKESEIAKSLGNPMEIAKEAREELGEREKSISLGKVFREFWKEVEDTSRKVWKNVEKEIPHAQEKIKNAFERIEEKSRKKTKRKNNRRAWKMAFLVMLNFFIMFWIIFAFYVTIFSLFISGISIIISGTAASLAGLFVLINPVSFTLKNLGWSAFFGGIGIVCLGWLWSIATLKLGKGLSWLVSKYTKSTFGWAKK